MNKLKKLVLKNGITPYKLSKKTGIDHSTIYRLISGEQEDILLQKAFRIADALGVDINDLREDEKANNDK
ncbi:helix-turn-helix domain-containing protein [Bavariicoccus seileri]|uniref:helix-turn-helix domain-containing protein n=1 Tax=Bavariicoccus seileri TaxID=549685 RepID=UPI0003B54423|nr:helix-turn-helix transcriptional regulator [Bavariicoccus seileri]